jgi:S-adenosylmethionine synthetase
MTIEESPSSIKRGSMNFKYQGTFSPTVVSSKIDKIKDTEIRHLDMRDFVERIKKKPLEKSLEAIVNINLHRVSIFLVVVQCPKFTLQVAAHYIREHITVRDSSKKVMMKLDVDLFDMVFQVPTMDKYIDMSIKYA